MRKRFYLMVAMLAVFAMLLAGCAEGEQALSSKDILGTYEGTITVVKVIEGEEIDGEQHSLGNEVGDVEPYYLWIKEGYEENEYKTGFDKTGEDWTFADYDPKTGTLTYGAGEMLNAELTLTEKDGVSALTGKITTKMGVWGGTENEVEIVKVSDEVPQE